MTIALHFIDPHTDPWRIAPEAPAPQPAAGLLLRPEQWRAVRTTWPAEVPVGVLWPNDTDITGIAPDLPRLDLIALHFPKWTDGRAYSQARLLRGRWRFRGQIRATGDVIADMAPLLWRCGFDAVVLRAGESVAVAQRALHAFDAHYQPDVRHPVDIAELHHA
ncbi:DUF934 domain-containing protein [Tepidimonas taiwanensis]|uniref:Oxidoreductase n=1 Tax=Tepidimonas taiwanensis TaxID=307486 RepID=A0A554XAH4_9BURK|nr:DUF934 domain-containing protein [Tepidimonas taiwanensis]MCX7692877.1 DUF934 domain-containing protein [Tepidimonas taiwanensis]MDM7464499.1 DUF934 domain-containing protein [Tepidimonas taiwanensis]TSE32833.1 hypothetical protein Ttaiw_00941 [Tepidimonas taiwanensis]UBQ05655.1 DUF934 domain-containing protein [Tepidimonas taiwanensis]